MRGFAADAARLVTVPLAQTGEGIKECELIEWHIKVIPVTSHVAALQPSTTRECQCARHGLDATTLFGRKVTLSRSLTRYAKCKATRQLWRSRAATQALCTASAMILERWCRCVELLAVLPHYLAQYNPIIRSHVIVSSVKV